MSIKIALVDDHALLRRGVVDALNQTSGIEIVGEFGKGLQVLQLVNTNPPEILILDLHLPDINGDELLQIVKKINPSIKVIMLSSNENIYAVKMLLNNGADGYLFKDSSHELLLEAIYHVLENDSPFLTLTLKNAVKKRGLSSEENNSLTPRELEVLQLLAKEMTSVEIAEKLEISPRTVEVYRLGLLQKFKVKNIVGLVKKAIMFGFIKE